jgi:diguanylate cyclase (GGDEF)-like protein/PAS domain S-box-containing protein
MRTVGRLVPPLATRRRFRAHSRFHSAFREASLGMAFVNVEEETFGQLLEVNPALCEITGYGAEQLEATSIDALTAIADIDEDLRLLRALAAGEVRAYEVERRWQHAAGHHVWVMVSASMLHDAVGQPLCALLQLQDIDQRKHLERQLEYLADHDPVTGLFNRRRFERELGRELAYARRYGGSGAVLMIDLDDLKRVNDRYGHAAGDQLIAGVAGLLRARLRTTDVVARMGGDEFAVLVPRGTLAEAESLAGELNEVVREGGASASIGVGCFDGIGEQTCEEVLLGADHAMYAAKESGRDRFVSQPTEEEVGAAARERLTWPGRIRKALDEDLFELHAQPVVDLRSGDVHQHELLIRLPGDDGELILPSAFLYTAERFGLTRRLDRWVVSQAVDLAAAGHQLGVNISSESLTDPALPLFVEEALERAGADPRSIVFEVTERAAISGFAQAQSFIEHMAGLGCRFALDDFGAGFGCFYYLKHLPLDYLKIDGEFVRGLPQSKTDQILVASVVELARGLGKQTIAEYVGDEATVEILRDLGVDYAQGFHTGRPAPLAEALTR